ncbi:MULTISPECIES: site-specific integrase [Bacteroides]|uniref:site-specific integrase n=1 Tax=Bacteroides TaxID=816 RepID=UPI0034A33A83
MASVKIILEKGREYKSGGFPLVVQIIHKRRKRAIYVGYGVKSDCFNSEQEKVVYSPTGTLTTRQVKDANTKAKDIKSEILEKVILLESEKREYTVKDVLSYYNEGQQVKYLYKFFEYEIARLHTNGKICTSNSYQWTLNSLRKNFSERDILFANMTQGMIVEYCDKLKANGVSDNTVNYYIHNLHAIYNKALNKGVKCASNSPFYSLHLKQVKTAKRALNCDEMRQIVKTDLTDKPHFALARDVFMFSFYTRGMSFVDIVKLKHEDIKEGIISYKRSKTGRPLQVEVTEQIQKIMDRYSSDSIYVFGMIEGDTPYNLYKSYKNAYVRLNRNLKQIAQQLSLGVNLTSYVARHSWANIAKQKGIPIAIISEGMGHSSERLTRIYLKDFDSSVIDDANKLVSCL